MVDLIRSLWRGFPAQIITFAILPLSILVVIVTIGSFVLHQRAMLDMVRRMENRTLAVTSQRLNSDIVARLQFLQSLPSNLAPPDQTESERLADQFELGWIWLPDNGAVQTSETHPVTGPASLLQTWLADNSPELNEIIVSPPLWQSGNGAMIAMALRQESGVLVGYFDPVTDAFRPLFESNMLPERGSPILRLTAPGEEELYLAWSSEQGELMRAEDSESWAALMAEPSRDYIVSKQHIPVTGWEISYLEPWQATDDPLLEATEYAPLLVVPIVLAAMASIWFGMKNIVIPVRQLAAQATDLGEGNYDVLNGRVEAIDEIQQLQAELNHMALQVKDAQNSLRDYVDAVTVGQEEERKRLAREIHDSTIQALIALNQRIQLLQMALYEHPRRSDAEQLETMATEIIADLRRLTGALRPIYLEDLGLVSALEMLVAETGRTNDLVISCEVTGEPARLSARTELTVFRIAQEALQNCIKHSGATEVCVHLAFQAEAVTLLVADNGSGFKMPQRP
ncbi:MAG: hypothetical protein KDE09_11930, partial [Anaerolineales bacterium]|nr:hypothetical protein [Anaerolineales bacterium]